MRAVADASKADTRLATVRIAGGPGYACDPGDTVLRAGLRAGLGLPYECNAGGCGSCKFELLSGEVDDLWPEAPGIRPKERERGRRLACQSVPRGDCEIKIRTAQTYVPQMPARRITGRFLGSRAVTADIREFDFLAAGAANFLPGQYALLRLLHAGQDRAYSMSNQPNAQGLWRFMIRRVPGGKVSGGFFDALQEGAEVGIDGPYGIAHLRPALQRDIVCIAGGSGLAPMVSIINGAVAHSALEARDAWLFYGGRGPADIPKIGDFIHPHPRVRFHPAISMPGLAEGTRTSRGSITKTGNAHARRLLTESAWNYRFKARIGREALARQEALPESIRTTAWKAQLRLTQRFAALRNRGVQINKACVAVARELAGFIWAIGLQVRREEEQAA